SINTWIIEPQVEYEKVMAKAKLSILVGTTFQQNISQSQAFFASGFTNDALIENILSAPNLYGSVYNYAQYRYNALFGRISYDRLEKYLINITGRRDGSSRFGPGKQFGNFGAIGLGWIFSNESFIQKGLPFFSYGKIRGSYGTTGSDQGGDYGFLNTYTFNSFP